MNHLILNSTSLFSHFLEHFVCDLGIAVDYFAEKRFLTLWNYEGLFFLDFDLQRNRSSKVNQFISLLKLIKIFFYFSLII